jgi:hypothetical protein
MALMDYANRVTIDIIRGASRKIWCGTSAGGVKFVEDYVPQSLMMSAYS